MNVGELFLVLTGSLVLSGMILDLYDRYIYYILNNKEITNE